MHILEKNLMLYTHQQQPWQFLHGKTTPEREPQQNAPVSADSLFAMNRIEKERRSGVKKA